MGGAGAAAIVFGHIFCLYRGWVWVVEEARKALRSGRSSCDEERKKRAGQEGGVRGIYD